MPELPEVETIRRHLAPSVEGRTIVGMEVLDARWSEHVVESWNAGTTSLLTPLRERAAA